MTYLVGDFSEMRENYKINPVRRVDTITRDHLIKTKENRDYNVINVKDGTFFNPDKNEWTPLEEK